MVIPFGTKLRWRGSVLLTDSGATDELSGSFVFILYLYVTDFTFTSMTTVAIYHSPVVIHRSAVIQPCLLLAADGTINELALLGPL